MADTSLYKTFDFKMKHVLVVDDDVALTDTLRALLESHDFLVSTMTNGVDALKLVMDMDVDAIICDLMMPRMAGDMFFKAVERVKPRLCAKFVFVTGYENHPRFADFLKQINGTVLYKPVTPGKLIGTLKVAMAKVPSNKGTQYIYKPKAP